MRSLSRRSLPVVVASLLISCGEDGSTDDPADTVETDGASGDTSAGDTADAVVDAEDADADAIESDIEPADTDERDSDATTDPDGVSPDADTGGCGPGDDDDEDGVCDAVDRCPDFDDSIDADFDTVPDACDVCGGEDDLLDEDDDGTPDGCDRCANEDDSLDEDDDSVPDGCDVCGDDDDTIDADSDGTPDCADECPLNPLKVSAGRCGCQAPDIDSDLDGALDCLDACPTDTDKIELGVCGCFVADTDRDTDGTPDCNDDCPDSDLKVTPGVCGCDVPDLDTDNDEVLDCNDGCPTDAAKVEPGVCDCGTADIDTDSDGTLDCFDGCPDDRLRTEPNTCGCGIDEIDLDDDGVFDCVDNCDRFNPDQLDLNDDGVADACDDESDADGDGTVDSLDCAAVDPNRRPGATEQCNLLDDDCDGTVDEDGVCACVDLDTDPEVDLLFCWWSVTWNDAREYCRTVGHSLARVDTAAELDLIASSSVFYPMWLGLSDAETEGDWRWLDGDSAVGAPWAPLEPNDYGSGEDCGALESYEGAVVANDLPCDAWQSFLCGDDCGSVDTDGDGRGDLCDRCPDDRADDTDGDGSCDSDDACPFVHAQSGDDVDADGVPDACDRGDYDGDGVEDRDDGCPADMNKVLAGVCGCGAIDSDTDGDEVLDCNDGCPDDAEKVDPLQCGCGEPEIDTDGDGASDCVDNCPTPNPNQWDFNDNGVGDECDSVTDQDGDGHVDAFDCAPANPAIHPGATERCDGVDNDCDGLLDVGAGDCPSSCTTFAVGSSDYLNCTTQVAFYDAADRCELVPGYMLASIDSTAEQDALSLATGRRSFWIGLSARAYREWVWINGSTSTNYTWAMGEPNGGIGSAAEDCVEVIAVTGWMNDVPCSTYRRYICEYGCTGFDSDGDGLGDACDRCPNDRANDADGDGICADGDPCPGVAFESRDDLDADGIPDACDLGDADGDGVADRADECMLDVMKSEPGQCGCGEPETNTDSDDFADCIDLCVDVASDYNGDNDFDGLGDSCDPFTDTDRDGVDNSLDCAPFNPLAHPGNAEICDGIDNDCDPFTTTEADACGCTSLSVPGLPHSYMACHEASTFAAAVERCGFLGDYSTVSYEDLNEWNLISSRFTTSWVGLRGNNSAWVWANGSTSTFTRWSSTPPPPGNGQCVYSQMSPVWGSISCDFAFPAVCESECGGIDRDGDGLNGACDRCPLDPLNDVDGDGICADVDRCPISPSPDLTDSDGDGVPNACDIDADSDGDGTIDLGDYCPNDPTRASSAGCGCGSIETEGCNPVCYPVDLGDRDGLLCSTRQSWDDASASCASFGMQLAVLDTDVSRLSASAAAIEYLDGANFWIGLSDALAEGVWLWNNLDPLLDPQWSFGEPNNTDGDTGPGEDCAQQYPGFSQWNDAACDSVEAFACTPLASF